MIVAGTHAGISFSLSAGQKHDAPQSRKLIRATKLPPKTRVVMDKGYSDKKTRKAVRNKKCVPVVPPKSNAKKPWKYDKELYKRRNEIERCIHHLKSFRRIATRYDKLDCTFRSFIAPAFVMLRLKVC
jgi:transposase